MLTFIVHFLNNLEQNLRHNSKLEANLQQIFVMNIPALENALSCTVNRAWLNWRSELYTSLRFAFRLIVDSK